jgi:hypothetical protein
MLNSGINKRTDIHKDGAATKVMLTPKAKARSKSAVNERERAELLKHLEEQFAKGSSVTLLLKY